MCHSRNSWNGLQRVAKQFSLICIFSTLARWDTIAVGAFSVIFIQQTGWLLTDRQQKGKAELNLPTGLCWKTWAGLRDLWPLFFLSRVCINAPCDLQYAYVFMHRQVSERPRVCLSLCSVTHLKNAHQRSGRHSCKYICQNCMRCPIAQPLPATWEHSEHVTACTWAGASCFWCPYTKPSSISAWAAAGSILENVSVNCVAFARVRLAADQTLKET